MPRVRGLNVILCNENAKQISLFATPYKKYKLYWRYYRWFDMATCVPKKHNELAKQNIMLALRW